MYAPLTAVARMLTAPRPSLPTSLSTASEEAQAVARTELESSLAQLAVDPDRLPVAAPRVVWLAAVTSALHIQRFFPFPGVESAFLQHVSTMVHRTLLYSYRDHGWRERDHFGKALRQLENVRALLISPAGDLGELQYVRLHLADLSNYVAFAAYQAERPPESGLEGRVFAEVDSGVSPD